MVNLFLDSSRDLFHTFFSDHSVFAGKLLILWQGSQPCCKCRKLEAYHYIHQNILHFYQNIGWLPDAPSPEESSQITDLQSFEQVKIKGKKVRLCYNTLNSINIIGVLVS